MGPTWSPKIVISQATGIFLELEFDTVLVNMLSRVPFTQKDAQIMKLISFAGAAPPWGGPVNIVNRYLTGPPIIPF